jgi:hypothetical protein
MTVFMHVCAHAERVGAVARGVQVVVNETRPDHYTLAELPDK